MSHTLLLADDSVTIRRVIELTFADEQVTVQSVSSGREALDRIAAAPPDIVLADIGMADVSGYDIAAHIKGRDDLRQIPVVLLAGAFEPLDEARARDVGSDAVLVKPFEPQMVVARVRELLERPSTTRATARPAAPQPPAVVPVAAVRPAPPAAARPEEVSSPAPAAPARAASPAPPEPAASVPPARNESADPLFDASLDRLDAAFADAQGPALDATVVSDFAQDLEQLRSHRGDAGFARDEFGDWDLPSRRTAPAEPPVADGPEPVQQPVPPPPAEADVAAAPVPPPPLEPLPPPVALEPRAVAPDVKVPSVVRSQAPAARSAPPPAPPLAEAFSSLLAAEEGRAWTAPPPPPAPVTADLSEEAIDKIVDKVVARLGAGVRGTVVDLAERLVRDEIDRLKSLR